MERAMCRVAARHGTRQCECRFLPLNVEQFGLPEMRDHSDRAGSGRKHRCR
jgi:hypothetical protein